LLTGHLICHFRSSVITNRGMWIVRYAAAWSKAAKNGRRYLAVTLDDPAYAKPVQARLVVAGAGFALLWDRE
jgi:uncharacterized protein (DUF736 family)